MRKASHLQTAILLLIILPTLYQTTLGRPYAYVTIYHAYTSKESIPVLIEADHNLKPDEVRSLGAYGLTTVAGPVAVLHADPASVKDLEKFSLRVERPHPFSVYLDQSVTDIGANEVWKEIRDPSGRNVTGAGIIIGFVDTGIDTTHPDFYFLNGSTKILYVWDQTIQGKPPPGFGYGYECTSSNINERTCPERDTFGHGTHVAGIAASSGQATGAYSGVAPGARIIFVKSGNQVCNGESWNFYDSQILDGINYIVTKAAQLKMRAVISLSLGGNIGGHDGTSPLELGLDAFVQAGTPIAVAAGNSAKDNAHIHGELTEGNNITVNLQVKDTTTDFVIDVWHSTRDNFEASLTAPNGETYSIPTPLGGLTTSYGNVTTLASSSTYGKELYMEVNSSQPLSSEVWKITLLATKVASTNGTWDAWVDTASCAYPGASFLPGNGYEIDQHDTIGIPGTARFVVAVGAYVTKIAWDSLSGENISRNDLTVGEIAPFSAWGPTRDGRVKPDLVAPGMFIASARAATVPKSNSDPDAFHRVLAGTSMATPEVAGVIALMLQYDPNLPAISIPQILRETARLDEFTGPISNGSPEWGFGKLDSRTATGLFRVTLSVQGIPSTLQIPILVDSARVEYLQGSYWLSLFFLKETRHDISVTHQIEGSSGTRYALASEDLLSLNDSALRILKYDTQYELSVNSQLGAVAGSGWYDENVTATIDVPNRGTATGWLGTIGGELVLTGLVADDGTSVSGSIVMNKPRTITAVYALTFPLQTYAELTALVLVVMWTAVYLIRRKIIA